MEALELLRSIQGPTLAHSGCLTCRVYEESASERSILLLEQWKSSAALSEWVRSDLYRRVLMAIELSSLPPEICVYHVSATDGLELIEQLRSGEVSTALGKPLNSRQ